MRYLAALALSTLVLAAVEHRALAEPDPLQTLLNSNPKCDEWKTVSRMTRDRLRKAIAGGQTVDLKLLELSFVLMDFCAGELQNIIVVGRSSSTTGLGETEQLAQRVAHAYAAIIAYYRDAYGSQEKATALKSWPYLSKVGLAAMNDLSAIIDRKFGQGSFTRYVDITSKPEASRTDAEKRTVDAMRPWMEPL